MSPARARLSTALGADIRLQVRHGFYTAYIVVTALYAVALVELARVSSSGVVRGVASALIFTDPATLGAFFVGGLVLLEKQQGSLYAVFVTPLRPVEYFVAKAVSLTVLATATSAVIAASTGLDVRPVPLFSSVVATSVLFVMLGLAVAARVRSVNGYLLAMVPVVAVPMIPLVRLLGVDSPLLWLIPTQASIRLIEAGLGGPVLGPGEIVCAALILPAACAAAAAAARVNFARHLLGEERRRPK